MIEKISQLDFADWWTLVVFPLFPLACWTILLLLIFSRRFPLILEKRSEAPWGAVDVVLLLGTMMFAKFLAQSTAVILIAIQAGVEITEVDQDLAMKHAGTLITTGIFFSLLQLAFAIWYLKNSQGSNFAHLGLSGNRPVFHLVTGFVAALLIIPVLLVINMILHAILRVEYSHQVMIMIRYSLISTACSTILVAPLVEEFHFRVVLQGFLQRIHHLDLKKKLQVILGNHRAEMSVESNASHKKESSTSHHEKPESKKESSETVPWWPIIISSLFFASVHVGQGAAPYALFVFSLFLGFLYRQTNSILPCIVVHVMLNLWSFIALVYSLD